jgi:hypothetical protein
MIAAIVAPAGFLHIAMTRACLVSRPRVGLDDAGADRLRDTGLAVFRAVERVAAFPGFRGTSRFSSCSYGCFNDESAGVKRTPLPANRLNDRFIVCRPGKTECVYPTTLLRSH